MNLRSLSLLGILFIAACSSTGPSAPVTQKKESVETPPLVSANGTVLSAEAWVAKAKENYVSGNFPLATRYLETAFVYEPQGPEAGATDLLFYLYLAQGDYPRALRLAQALVRKHPYRSQSYYQAGIAELWSANPRMAVENFHRCLEFEDHPIRTHYFLGMAFEKLGKQAEGAAEFQKAEKKYRQVLKKNPGDFSANFELAHLYLYWNVQWQKAESLVESARTSLKHPDLETVLRSDIYRQHYLTLLEGMYWTQKGDRTRALPLLWQALEAAPMNAKADIAEIYYFIGMNLASAGLGNPAGNFLRKASQMDPTGPYASKTEVALRQIASEKSKKKGKR